MPETIIYIRIAVCNFIAKLTKPLLPINCGIVITRNALARFIHIDELADGFDRGCCKCKLIAGNSLFPYAKYAYLSEEFCLRQ